MKVVSHEGGVYVIRLERGEEFLFALKKFCWEKKIEAGYFSAIGAAQKVTLSFYDAVLKKYDDKEFGELAPLETGKSLTGLEIVSLNGNVAMMKDEVIIHTHGCFSDREFRTHAGHVKQCTVGPTCEIILTHLVHPIHREPDEETGLNLLQ